MFNHDRSPFFVFITVDDEFFPKVIEPPRTGSLTSDERFIKTNKTEEKKILSAKEQLYDLRKYMGFNISVLARIMHVKRPTIYEWMNGKEPSRKNQHRLDAIYSVCETWKEKNAGWVGLYLYRKIGENNRCLIDLLEETNINKDEIDKLLDIIAKNIFKAEQEFSKKHKSLKQISKEEQRASLIKLTRKIS